ncbi:Protein interacting with Hsp90 1 [Termitomyces sp. J132]|nr:hypothetical protein H2248_002591 [Termitomyces sp. 'cryptogamus']KNZ79741.1 Protein interacting with Hsp90 1 [Termitomyces sp. J132]
MSTTIQLEPVAGFCIKSTVNDAPNHGLKVFVNIAWDPHVPQPPPGSELRIRRAMLGHDVDDPNPDAWYVPVVVSDGRQDKDKAGKPALVFDCVYNTSLKSRTLTDPEFKLFIVELALQRIEAQTSLVLSRQIGTPNIVSKGKLLPRTVNIPSSLLTEGSTHSILPAPSTTHQLIQEVSPPVAPSSTKPKGILKSASTSTLKERSSTPTWSWSKDGTKIQIKISLPNLPRALIEHATLDIEPRRFILHVPDYPVFDINLGLSDAEIVATAASRTSASLHDGNGTEPNNTLTLKRQRPLDVDGATSEWRLADNMLVIVA